MHKKTGERKKLRTFFSGGNGGKIEQSAGQARRLKGLAFERLAVHALSCMPV